MKAIICGALMALVITTANAAEEDGNSANFMLPYCKLSSANNKDAAIHGRCFGMVEAINATFKLMRSAAAVGKGRVDPALCIDIPDAVTNEQAVRVVVKYGEAHPERTRNSFTLFAVIALIDTWPCKG
jgi:hypothetical protein